MNTTDQDNIKRLCNGIYGMVKNLDGDIPDEVLKDLLTAYKSLTGYYCYRWYKVIQEIEAGNIEGDLDNALREHTKAVRYYKMVADTLQYGIKERENEYTPKQRKKIRNLLSASIVYLEGGE